MKRISTIVFLALALFGASCNSYLDINDNNPNTPTAVNASLVLPNALVATANVLNAYNVYGAQIGGYMANAGGYGGFNELVSYAYTSNNYAGNWSAAYDNLEDYQYILNSALTKMQKGDSSDIYYYAIARIMRVHNFQLLVDCYNDVPYTDALQGANKLTPKYDDAATIYSSLLGELNEAIQMLNKGDRIPSVNPIKNAGGNNTSLIWHQIANTLKVKLLVRSNGKATLNNTSIDAVGCLTTNVLINPGYKQDNGRQNPAWNTWAFQYTGASGNKAWIPTKYILGFYDGNKLNDAKRGAVSFYLFPQTGTNQLGVEGTGIPKCPAGSYWYAGTDRTISAGNSRGILKGPDAGYPLLTAAESYFLQAEAVERGLMTNSLTASQLFDNGIAASFTYLYTNSAGTVTGNPTSDATAYQSFNNNRLTQYNLANGQEERIEAIITQKYIALNMIASHEGWNDYRRTGYPNSATVALNAVNSFASVASQSTRQDKLPSRIPYPVSEAQYNPANIPTGISNYTSNIFWAK